MRRTGSLLLALLTAVAPVGAVETPESAEPLRVAAARAFEKARSATLGRENVTVGCVWNLQKVLNVRPDPELDRFASAWVERLADKRNARLIDPAAPRLELPETPGEGPKRLADYIDAAVGQPEDRALRFLDEYVALELDGYFLTHQLLALKWAEESGLELPRTLRSRTAPLLRKIALEQVNDRKFSDLYAERVSLLMLYGKPLKREVETWIGVIIEAQQEDGTWPSAHSMSLCMVCLALYLAPASS